MATARQTVDIDTVRCAMCLEVYEIPCKITCGHTFCMTCLHPFFNQAKSLCPMCRRDFDPRIRTTDQQMDNFLSSNFGVCEGCRQRVVLTQYRRHTASCQKLATLEASRLNNSRQILSPVHNVPNRQTFRCPYCHMDNLPQNSLVDHCLQLHSNSRLPVVCPVCASMPWGDATLVSANFITHLRTRHRFEYDTYVDYDQDDDTMMHAAIMASLSDH